MQIALECRLSADGLGFAIRHDRAIVATVRCVGHPGAVTLAELVDQHCRIRARKLADRAQPKRLELLAGLGSDAVQLTYRERPYKLGHIVFPNHRNTAGL